VRRQRTPAAMTTATRSPPVLAVRPSPGYRRRDLINTIDRAAIGIAARW